jgi:hypothetical protein
MEERIMWHNGGQVLAERSCREALEDTAARVKKQLDVRKELHGPLTRYVDSGVGHDFNGEDRKTLFAIVGGLSMEIPKLEAEYQALLAKIEAGEK